MSYIYDLVDTWASGGGPYTSIKMNATDNDVGSASLLMDLQIGGSSRFQVAKDGAIGIPVTKSLYQIGNPAFNITFSGSGVIALNSAASAGITVNGPVTVGATDLILSRRAAANLRLGAADTTGTTAPTPQFLSAQSWSSSTTFDQLGANFTINGSQGTGTGAGGSIIFQVAPAGGTSNGVQNALAPALAIGPNKAVTFYGNIAQFGNGASISTTFFTTDNSSGAGLYVRSNTSPNISLGTADDVKLTRDAANTLALRNGANAQTFRVYNTTDGTNSEYGFMKWNGTTLEIGAEKSGTGLNRAVTVRSNSGVLTLNDGNSSFQLTSGQVSLGTRSIFQLVNISGQSGYSEMIEMTAPAAPAANGVRIYAEDNGSGKTRIMALFPTGAAVQIAIEP